MIREVLRMGDPRLLRRAAPVERFATPELLALIQDMRDTMAHLNGAGLAAPQIGVDLRLVIFGGGPSPRYPDASSVPDTVVINFVHDPLPVKGVNHGVNITSVPGLRGWVPRWTELHYAGFDEQGRPLDRRATGFHARVVQHECDHLDGVLYPMRVRDFSRFGYTDVLFPNGMMTADD